MEKSVIDNEVLYHIAWSPIRQFDKYTAGGIPEMPGIICLFHKRSDTDFEYLLFYSCWRNGLRIGLKDITDPDLKKFPQILPYVEMKNLYYRYTVIDSGLKDMNDVLYWLIKEYQPEFNNTIDFEDSGRYKDIFMKESAMSEKDVIERIPKIRT